MGEQKPLLEEMLARAEVSVKELGERLIELQARQDAVGPESCPAPGRLDAFIHVIRRNST